MLERIDIQPAEKLSVRLGDAGWRRLEPSAGRILADSG